MNGQRQSHLKNEQDQNGLVNIVSLASCLLSQGFTPWK